MKGVCRIFFIVILTLNMVWLFSCSKTPNQPAAINGFSGMANIDSTRFLAVHDEKNYQNGPRVSVIITKKDSNITVLPVEIKDWRHAEGRSSDLEAVCSIPGRTGEFLLVESGHWDGKFGRMFHIKLNLSKQPYQATVLGVFELPEFDAKGPGDVEGDEIEGAECVALNGDSVLVLLGERGGSSVYPTGLLRWVVADLGSDSLLWTEAGKKGKTVEAPGVWQNPSKNRDIAALHLDTNNILWASATEDPGDSGPFNTVLYRIGTVTADITNPIQLDSQFTVARSISGFKTEALAGPTTKVKGSTFSIGTEDEIYGGVWRPIQ
ncbi:hypothetical protein KC799_06050 [candidate division KSB1 bacterium]|nr:hypothetical protein [candidate division KSB1 bacterium]